MRKVLSFCMLLCVIMLSSCIAEPVFDSLAQTKNVITFTLYNSSTTPQATKATRAVDDMLDNEKAINRIDIFFYDESGTNCLFYPGVSNITINNGQVSIKVPESIMASLYNAGDCKVYMLVNCQLSREAMANKTLDEIKKMSMDNVTSKKFNLATPPSDFLMDSEEIDVAFNENSPNPNLGKIFLKRAAAKVVVDITSAKITGYIPMEARVTIVNYLDVTKLSGEYLYSAGNNDYKSASKTLTLNDGTNNSFIMNSQDPIYTYANNWEGDPSKQTYILIAIDWYNTKEATTKTYYYRIPFSYIRAEGDMSAYANKINRNYIYQFAVNITRLGGLDPADAVDVATNFDLLDWTTKVVEVSILEYHFLFVYNPDVEIHNRKTNMWEYKSSKEPITVKIKRVYCNEYDIYGGINPKEYTASNPQYPQITTSRTSDNRTYFSFESMVPINYVPLYITATVSNPAGLSTDVSLTIYPKIYVTASYSYGGYSGMAGNPDDKGIITSSAAYAMRDGVKIWLAGSYLTPDGTSRGAGTNIPNGEPNSSPPQKNFNFFTVHVTSLDIEDEEDGMRVGDPTEPITHLGSTAAFIDEGDPVNTGFYRELWEPLSPYFRTLKDDEHNKIVSPQFVIASQRGITSSKKTWGVARQRCATYRESQYAAGSWRMPTLAELKLVRKMQLDPNSAIKELFQSTFSSGWWTAQEGASVVLGDKNDDTAIRIGQSGLENSVRCVRDLWRD